MLGTLVWVLVVVGAVMIAAWLVAGVVIVSSGRRRRRRACLCQIERRGASPRGPSVVLVHGTFGKHAAWLGRDAPFRRTLDAALGRRAAVYGFCWSGSNSHVKRLAAAARLADRIGRVSSGDGGQVFVVAHSHGGNVALHAAARVPGAVGGVVTLATPFLYFSSRHLPRLRIHLTAAVGAGALFFAANDHGPRWLLSLAGALAAAFVALFALSAAIAAWQGRRLAGLDPASARPPGASLLDADAVAATLNPPPAALPETLVLTPVADEAATGLTGAQLTGWLMAPLQRLSAAGSWRVLLLGLAGAFAVLLPVVLLALLAGEGVAALSEANPGLVESAVPAGVYDWLLELSTEAAATSGRETAAPIHPMVFFTMAERYVLDPVTTGLGWVFGAVGVVLVVGLAAAVARAVSLLAVGADALFWSIWARPVVQQAPLGRSTIETIDVSADGARGLHHGRLYADGTVAGTWIAERLDRS